MAAALASRKVSWTDWVPIRSIPSDAPGRPILFIRVDLPVIDAPPVLDDPARPGAFKLGLSTDGVHPNLDGHTAVAAQLTPVLRKLTQVPAPALGTMH